MSRTTIVKLTGEGHDHGPGPIHAEAVANATKGTPIRIVLPPVAVMPGWLCDTQCLWCVPGNEVARFRSDGPITRYVCEHMIDVD